MWTADAICNVIFGTGVMLARSHTYALSLYIPAKYRGGTLLLRRWYFAVHLLFLISNIKRLAQCNINEDNNYMPLLFEHFRIVQILLKQMLKL